jgi:hypothetical protein
MLTIKPVKCFLFMIKFFDPYANEKWEGTLPAKLHTIGLISYLIP